MSHIEKAQGVNEQTNLQAHLVALGTIVRREVKRILRIWGQTLVPPVITMTLYFLIFGNLIGSRIGATRARNRSNALTSNTGTSQPCWRASTISWSQ